MGIRFASRSRKIQCHVPLRLMSTLYFTSPPNQHSEPPESDFRHWNKKISHLIRTNRLSDAHKLFDSLAHRNTVTWNSLITGYVKNRQISKARKLFDEMSERDTVSWNLMISGYVSCRGSRYVEEGRFLFDQMPCRDSFSWNTMISGYAMNGMMDDALCLFRRMSDPNVVSCNAIITGFLQNGDVSKAIDFFEKMPERDSTSLSALVSGLIQNNHLDAAAQILFNTGIAGGDMVHAYNTLIAGYGAIGRVVDAREVFDKIPVNSKRGKEGGLGFVRNVVSWNSMIMCYVKSGDLGSARMLFNDMNERDVISWNTMISGYAHASNMEEASNLFHKMPHPDAQSWNSMISGYAQKGDLCAASDFFNKMPKKSLVSWNSMIAGYEQNGDCEEALQLFHRMQKEGEIPDKHTLSSVLGACAGISALYNGMVVHQLIVKTVIADTPIYNSLVTMYSRCGVVAHARSVFDEIKLKRDVVSWNAIIGGYAYQGHAMEALMLYREMKQLKVKPTHITFVSVLNACAHAGLVDEGRSQFKSMVSDFGIQPQVEHFASLVDLLGRHGHLEEAMALIDSMPVKPDRAVWGALLGACKVHNNMSLASIAAKALMALDPDSSAPYVLLYNMHADAGRWDDAMDMRVTMERKGIRKQPGYSWIELDSYVNIFLASDKSHPSADEIHAVTKSFDRITKDIDLIKSIF